MFWISLALIPFFIAMLMLVFPQVCARGTYRAGRALLETSASGRSEMDRVYDEATFTVAFRRAGYVFLAACVILVDLGLFRLFVA